ncbi:DUF3618 domain-containing protein [Devosia sp. RR2S18]|uniref:DUF3618 domain-containing protein n=1 Tax=Devosia rhizosphaerae TaxID=3049774 RepID=UPI00254144D0|nr:DUF3618 domain-containing protein [Devosia sp. RR2S18]WIJ24797.1 DUF3618 domain-containing protein [Devosia sp. RR2S18]
MAGNDQKSSAELQREVDLHRRRIDERLDQIQQKLSPGEILDDFLSQSRGGGEMLASLQRQVTTNPLPVLLLGVAAGWLFLRPGEADGEDHEADRDWDRSINMQRGYRHAEEVPDTPYPLIVVSGTSMQRAGHSEDEHGNRFAEFVDEAGRRFHAATDKAGRRIGDFRDESGNKFRGFTDTAGNRIHHFRDEAGDVLEEASHWAADTWQLARRKMHDLRDTVSGTVSSSRGMAASGAVNASTMMRRQAGIAREQAGHLGDTGLQLYRDQPLIAGALAFALGAAIASALPRTRQEDEVLGRASDSIKAKLGEEASHLYEEGRAKAAELHETVVEKVSETHEKLQATVSGAGSGSTQDQTR